MLKASPMSDSQLRLDITARNVLALNEENKQISHSGEHHHGLIDEMELHNQKHKQQALNDETNKQLAQNVALIKEHPKNAMNEEKKHNSPTKTVASDPKIEQSHNKTQVNNKNNNGGHTQAPIHIDGAHSSASFGHTRLSLAMGDHHHNNGGEGSVPSIGRAMHLRNGDGQSPYGSREPSLASNYALVLGLPMLSCVIIALILYIVWRFCRRLRQTLEDKQQRNNGNGAGNSTSKTIGQVIDSLDEIHIIGTNGSTKKSKLMDERQLTLNMEEDDSDERIDAAAAARRKVNKQKRANKKSNQITMKQQQSLGQLKYQLSYDFSKLVLAVTIMEARNLPGMDFGGSSDPYVKVCLLPDKRTSYKTRTYKRTLNPVFNETFEFQIDYAELSQRTLSLMVYDYDRFSRHDEIGQVNIAIASVDLSQTTETWAELERSCNTSSEQVSSRYSSSHCGDAQYGCNCLIELSQSNSLPKLCSQMTSIVALHVLVSQLGDICLSLRYVPSAGRLTVVVMEARQLKKMDVAGLSDPYVKLALTSYGKRIKKKKTSIKKCTLNPHYNESFSFEIPFEEVQKVQLVVTVVDYDRIGTSEPIGKVILGCDATTGETELRHWMDMLASPRRPIAQWHSLKDIDFERENSSAEKQLQQQETK